MKFDKEYGWTQEKGDETISVKLGNAIVKLEIEEFHPYEPSAYVTDPGWTCFDNGVQGMTTEYFVSTSGAAYKQPENEYIGEIWKEEDDIIMNAIKRAHERVRKESEGEGK